MSDDRNPDPAGEPDASRGQAPPYPFPNPFQDREATPHRHSGYIPQAGARVRRQQSLPLSSRADTLHTADDTSQLDNGGLQHQRSKTDGAAPPTPESMVQVGNGRPTIHKSASTPLSLPKLPPKAPWDPLEVYKRKARVELGDLPEEDGFLPLIGEPRVIKRPGSWRPGFEPPWDTPLRTPSLIPAAIHRGEDFPNGPYQYRRLSECVRKRWIKLGPLRFDVRYPPTEQAASPTIANPTVPWIRLYHPALPWFIDIIQGNANGVTLWDVMSQVHEQLMIPLTEGDVWNELMTDGIRRKIVQAYRERCGIDSTHRLMSDGPRLDPVRLDVLGSDCAFEGLKDNWSGKACYKIAFRDWRI